MKRIANIFVLCAASAIALPAQTFTTLVRFDGTDGELPFSGLVQGADGNLYGTTSGNATVCSGGECGTVFKISPRGTLTTLYSFCAQNGCTDGLSPYAGLVLATNGDFYGTTQYGGAYGSGTVFKITPGGALTTLYSFCPQGDGNCTDGQNPSVASLVQAHNGDFYGATQQGGGANSGTIFTITPSGTLTTLYSFCSAIGCPDGSSPNGLIQAADGDFYGTTGFGGVPAPGAAASGTVFKITASGALTTLYTFCCASGSEPLGALVQGVDGNFYGTTTGGGTGAYGTVFEITPTGKLTKLYNFCSQSGCTDGSRPYGQLVHGTDGNFYGTTIAGGANYGGTIFKITPSGALTTLYSFCSSLPGCADGYQPTTGLVQATNGNFYGTTFNGGMGYGGQGFGTVFRLSVGLGPFVKTLPHSGTVGEVIRILGTDLTGATSVSFNGTPAAFNVVSATEITATVPAGATTGKIRVTTPGGALFSGGPFLVLP
jgi:uncharacterized repeat protein (TIGR03803 family)